MAGIRDRHTKISLYENRSVGEIINIAIDFLRQNWRTALRLSVYMLFPIALLHSVGIFTLVMSLTRDNYNSTDMGFMLNMLFFFIGLSATYTLILTLVQYYQGSADGDLSMLTFRDVRGTLWRNFRRVFTAMIPILLLMVVCSLFFLVLMIIPLVSIAAFVAYFLLFFIMMMIPIYYVLEGASLSFAFKRSFTHAKESWGKLFGLMYALLLVVFIILSATSTPMMVFIFAKDSLLPSGKIDMTTEMIFSTIIFVFLVIETFFAYLSMALVVTAMVFHYGRNARLQDDLALGSDIDNFANL
ncbi:MAG: hypothetical protein J6X22_00105 [Muribaculaceae bacterium]|nr:hypothetical protein [Muribaculaceae bacterium]